MGFIYPALDQIANHASRLRTRTRGRLSVPMVLRVPYGGGIRAPEHHSESVEAMLAHIPGLRVVIPSSPRQAYGLLLAAIDDPDPVVFLEPKRLYRSTKEPLDDAGLGLPLDICRNVRSGDDLTIITWGAMLQEVLGAAETLAEEGAMADVIDVTTLKPFDAETVLKSVARTGRVVIVQEAARTCGFAGEIAACIAEKGLFDLEAPIMRVTGFDTVMPLPQLESLYMPDVARVLQASRRVLAL